MHRNLPFKYIFIIIIIFGTLLSLSSRHWLVIWAGLEINLIGFLPILVYQKKMIERESAVKYFIIQALGSRFIILGRLITFSTTLSWECITLNLTSLGNVFILISGLILKIGLFPFHFWFPGVIAGLRWFSCLFLTTWQKVAPIFLIMAVRTSTSRLLLVFLVSLIARGSSVAGGVGGLNQTQIRALIAYSSIGHIGWILFALDSRERSVKFYFLIYSLISLGMFLRLSVLDVSNMKTLSSISNRVYLGSIAFVVILLSLGGLPPLLGFIAKWLIFSASVSQRIRGLLIILILGSLIRLFYYLSLFFSEALNLKRNAFSLKHVSKVTNQNYIVAVLFVNILGGLLFFLLLPRNFI